MRYVVDARYAGPRPSGIGQYVRALGRRLPALSDGAELCFWIRPGTDHFASGPNVSYRSVPWAPGSLATLLGPRWLSPLEADDVFHAPANVLGFGLPCPALVTVHDLMWLEHLAWCQPRPWLRPVSGAYFGAGIRHALKQARRILTVSRASADAIVRLAPGSARKLLVTPNACEPHFRPPESLEAARAQVAQRIGSEAPYFLVVGQNQPSKAHDVALRAFAAVALPEQRLVLAQRLEPGRGLHGLAQELGIAPRVSFVNELSEADLVSVFQAATALLQPSLAEGFGLPALEAMACGTPVIASDIAPLREVLGEAGTFALAGDARELSLAMKRLAGDAGLRQALSAAGLERAKHFSWDTTAALTWEAYRDVGQSTG